MKDRHQAEHDAHSPAGAGPCHAHEICIYRIIDIRYQHADDRGDAKPRYEPWHRCLRHFYVLSRLPFALYPVHIIPPKPLFLFLCLYVYNKISK